MKLWDRWQASLTPADTREIWDWAHQEGELPSVYAVSGRFDVNTCPMVKPVLRALRSPIVRNVVVMAGVQCLKTLIGELWLLWTIANDPGPSQWLQPDNEEAKEHAQERFIPLIEKFPIVHRFYTDSRFDKTNRFIRFKNSYLRMEGAHEQGNTQRKSIKNQMRSEIWQHQKWIRGRLLEASSRQMQFVHNSKSYTESQPGWCSDYGQDDMHGAFLAGDQQVLNFRCQACQRLQPFLWDFRRHDGTRAAIRWDDNERTRRENGEWRWSELLQTLRYECINCGHRHCDDPLTRRRITSTLEFVPSNPDADPATKSFTWNQLAMPNLSWFETKIGGVKNFLLAYAASKRGDDKPLRDFWMKVVAEPYSPERHAAIGTLATVEIIGQASRPESQQGGDSGLPARRPAGLPPIIHDGIEFIHRYAGVDVQADHLWALAEFWSARGDSITMDFQKLYTWDELADWQRRWGILDQDMMIDVQHRGEEVKDNCISHGHWGTHGGQRAWLCWKALRGSDQDEFIWLPRTGPNKGKRFALPYTWPPELVAPYANLPANDPRKVRLQGHRCMLITWSNPTIKDVVLNRRDGKVRGCQSLVARGPWNAEFQKHMHSQRKEHVETKWGGGKWKWVKRWDDHGLDCKCMATVRAYMAGLLGPLREAA